MQMLLPPGKLKRLHIDRGMAFVREDITDVAVYHLCQGMPFCFPRLEMPPFQYSPFIDLCPFLRFRELGEGCCEWWSTFPPNFDTIYLLSVLASALLNRRHLSYLPHTSRETLEKH